MIKPYLKSEHNATVVEVEDFGVIRLDELPIRVREDEEGRYEIGWVCIHKNEKAEYVLSEYGGRSSLDFGGRNLGVIRKIE